MKRSPTSKLTTNPQTKSVTSPNTRKPSTTAVNGVSPMSGKSRGGDSDKSQQPLAVTYEPSEMRKTTNLMKNIAIGIVVCLVVIVSIILLMRKSKENHCKEVIRTFACKIFNPLRASAEAEIKMNNVLIRGLSVETTPLKAVVPAWNNSGAIYFTLNYLIVYFNTSINATGLGIQCTWLQSHSHNVTFDVVVTLSSDEQEFELLKSKMNANIDHQDADSADGNDKIDPQAARLFSELLKDAVALQKLRDTLEKDIMGRTVRNFKPEELGDVSCFKIT